MIVRIGTRGSRLALIQAEKVRAALRRGHPGLETEIVAIKTLGDRVLETPLSRIGGKGIFIREIEEALLAGRIDLAVHSLKDLPTTLPDRLALGGTLTRDDPRDALVSADGRPFERLRAGERIGTSSLRRAAQLLQLNPDLQIVELRGNVDTRLRKMADGECEAVVLAACGLERAGLAERIVERFEPRRVLPAVCQGIIGVEIRRDDPVADLVAAASDPQSYRMAEAERAFLRRLEGGCQVPVGCLSRLEGERGGIEGLVASLDGRRIVRSSREGAAEDLVRLAEELAAEILQRGGGEILGRIRNNAGR